MKKRRSSAGETLVETLAAVLIVGIATTLFLTFVMTSSNMNQAAKGKDDAVYTALSKAELGEEIAGTPKVQFVSDARTDEVKVQLTGEEGGLYSYHIAEGGAP